MLKPFKIFIVFCFGFVFINIAFSHPLPNLTKVKNQLKKYHDSGQYYQDISNVVKEARDYMQFRLIQNQRARHPQKLAMVMDIDETVLSNYPNLIKLDFGGTVKEVDQLESQAKDTAIPYTRTLYEFARHNGITVFFVTGRREHLREATKKNLAKVGFTEYKRLFLKPEHYHKSSVVPYKSAMRHKIREAGYDIIVNIGDQESDLKGGFADMSFKVPNPYYLIG